MIADEKLILSQPLELMSLNLQQGDDSLFVTISKALPLFRKKGAGLRTSCSLTCVHASRALFVLVLVRYRKCTPVTHCLWLSMTLPQGPFEGP